MSNYTNRNDALSTKKKYIDKKELHEGQQMK